MPNGGKDFSDNQKLIVGKRIIRDNLDNQGGIARVSFGLPGFAGLPTLRSGRHSSPGLKAWGFLAGFIKPDNVAPSLQSHYEPSSLIRATPPLCPTSVLSPSWALHLSFLPYHRNDRFPRSTQEPGSGSRYLYAGRCPSSKQASLGLLLEFSKPPVLTSSYSFRHLIGSSLALASLNLT